MVYVTGRAENANNFWRYVAQTFIEKDIVEVGKQDVRLEAGKVIKVFNKDLELEARKHQQLAQLARLHGFCVPELLAQDDPIGTLAYEYIAQLNSCREQYLDYATRGPDSRRDAWQEALFAKIGRVLAIIHRELNLEPQASWQAPPTFDRVVRELAGTDSRELLAQSPQATLHGDFGFSNVCTTQQEPQRLVVIDPSPNFYSSFVCNERASVYLDIGKFSVCLRGLVPRRDFFRLRRSRMEKLSQLFLGGYAQEAGWEIDTTILGIVERAHVACKLRYEMPRRWARMAASIMLFGWKDGRVIGRIANGK